MIDVIGGPTQISPGQMRLPRLFSVERILASRGFQIKSEGIATDTLLTKNPWTFEEHNLMFEAFDNVIFRNELLTAIENPSFSSSHPEVSNLLALPTFKRDRNKFSTTFEWYVGELLVRKFQAFSSSFGVNVEEKDAKIAIQNRKTNFFITFSGWRNCKIETANFLRSII